MAPKKSGWRKKKSRGGALNIEPIPDSNIEPIPDSDIESILKSDAALRYRMLYENQKDRSEFLWSMVKVLITLLVAAVGGLITVLITLLPKI